MLKSKVAERSVSRGCSCDELADASLLSNASLSGGGELLSADNADTGWELTLAEDLEVSLEREYRDEQAGDYYLLDKRLTALVTSITAALSLVEAVRASSETSCQSLSRLIVGL